MGDLGAIRARMRAAADRHDAAVREQDTAREAYIAAGPTASTDLLTALLDANGAVRGSRLGMQGLAVAHATALLDALDEREAQLREAGLAMFDALPCDRLAQLLPVLEALGAMPPTTPQPADASNAAGEV